MKRALGLDKKGLDFLTNWVAILFLLILVLSFLLSAVIVDQWVNYVIVVFAGAVLGHFLFTSREGNRFPYYILASALLAGYLAGHRAGNGIVIAALFVGSIAATNKVLKLTR